MSGDIDIVVGAQDQASKILEQVSSNVSKMSEKVTSSGRASGGAASGMGSMLAAGGAMGVTFAAVTKSIDFVISSITSLAGSVSSAVADFDKATESVRALDQAMELNGGSSDALMEQYTGVANAIERLTNVEAEQVQSMMQQAAMLGVSNDQLDEVAMTAVGLSEAMGIELSDAMNKARLATEGHFESFNKLLPSLKDMQTEEEKLAAVQELASKGMAMKTAAADSAAHAGERLGNAWGNMMEVVGGLLSPIKAIVERGLTLFADAVTDYVEPTIESLMATLDELEPVFTAIEQAFQSVGVVFGVVVEAMIGVLGSFGEAIFGNGDDFKWWGDLITTVVNFVAKTTIGVITYMEVIYGNLGRVVELTFIGIQLFYESFIEDTAHTFTNVIPQYLNWFARNWSNVFIDLGNSTVAVFNNLGKNIGEAVAAIWVWVSNGMQGGTGGLMKQMGEAMFVDLLDGFEAKTEALPDIMERQLTSSEKELQSRMGEIGGGIATEFSTKYNERIGALHTDVKAKLDVEANSALAKVGKLEFKKDDVAKEKAGKGQNVASELKAVEGRLLTRGKDSESKALDLATKQLAEQQKQNALLTKMNERLNNIDPELSMEVEVATI